MKPEDELIIDPEAEDDEPSEHPTKTLVFVSTFDPSARVEVIPTQGQTVRDAAEVSGLTARDGSAWTVFDALGVEVAHLPSFDMIGDVLYVGPAAVSAGSPEEADSTAEPKKEKHSHSLAFDDGNGSVFTGSSAEIVNHMRSIEDDGIHIREWMERVRMRASSFGIDLEFNDPLSFLNALEHNGFGRFMTGCRGA